MKSYHIEESGKRIRTLRKAAGYTQEELAVRLGTDKSYLGHVESGRRGCSVDILVRLAEIFDVSLDYLILGDDHSGKMVKKSLDDLIQQLTLIRDGL